MDMSGGRRYMMEEINSFENVSVFSRVRQAVHGRGFKRFDQDRSASVTMTIEASSGSGAT